MNLKLKIFFCFCAVFGGLNGGCLWAQRQADFEAWTGIALRKDLPKGFAASVEWQSRFDNNANKFKRNYLYANADYKIKKWLFVLVQYRFSTNHFSDAQRFRAGINFKTKFKRFSFANRIVYQQQYGFLNEEWISEFGPSRALRNRLQIGYSITKKIGLTLSGEPSWTMESGSFSLRRIRYMTALNFDLPKKFNLRLFYLVQPDYNRVNPSLNYVGGLSIAYDLPGKKKDKSKKKAAEPISPAPAPEKPPHNE
jgi:hypothetical protein